MERIYCVLKFAFDSESSNHVPTNSKLSLDNLGLIKNK